MRLLAILLLLYAMASATNPDTLIVTDSTVCYWYDDPDTKYACIGKKKVSGVRMWNENGKTELEIRFWKKVRRDASTACICSFESNGEGITQNGTDTVEVSNSFYQSLIFDWPEW